MTDKFNLIAWYINMGKVTGKGTGTVTGGVNGLVIPVTHKVLSLVKVVSAGLYLYGG